MLSNKYGDRTPRLKRRLSPSCPFIRTSMEPCQKPSENLISENKLGLLSFLCTLHQFPRLHKIFSYCPCPNETWLHATNGICVCSWQQGLLSTTSASYEPERWPEVLDFHRSICLAITSRVPQTVSRLGNMFCSYRVWGTSLPNRAPQTKFWKF
jgi:hypothetical protein